MKKFSTYKEVLDNANKATKCYEEIEKAQETVRDFNDREVAFKQPVTDYEDLNQLKINYEPYIKLWNQAN